LVVAGVKALFVTDHGEPVTPVFVANKVKRYMQFAGIDKPGACHLFRHACATHMLEGGADIRFIQALLGHSKLDTTQIYTHVSIDKLKQIHAATHPARLQRREVGYPPTDASTPSRSSADAANALLEALGRDVDDDE
jgi:integrase/recombinase XerD